MSVSLPLLGLVFTLGWVLPAERVLEQMELARRDVGPVRAELALSGGGGDWPESLVVDLHPIHGARISDSRGGRWLLRAGRVVAANPEPVPAWLPDLELLVLNSSDRLRAWMSRMGVDSRLNELGRIGDRDCFVFGGRDGPAQLWVDKDRLEPLRVVLRGGRSYELGPYRSFGPVRFPSEIKVMDHLGAFASLRPSSVEKAPRLSPADFDSRWAGEHGPP